MDRLRQPPRVPMATLVPTCGMSVGYRGDTPYPMLHLFGATPVRLHGSLFMDCQKTFEALCCLLNYDGEKWQQDLSGTPKPHEY
jgi:hypothetical protein